VRVSLLYSPGAGSVVSLRELRTLIERQGHELVRVVDTQGDPAQLLDTATDLVVAAGGDGTVSTAAITLSGRGIPLAILPLGTANNIAKTLKDDDAVAQVIRRWDLSRRQPMDLGVASGSWGDHKFLEGAGTGLVPRAIRSVDDPGPVEHPPARLDRALWAYGVTLAQLEPVEVTVTLDGVSLTDEFLMVEVLNVPSIGPNLTLSGDADPSDGLFDVVLATEDDREELATYLRDRADGRDARVTLPSRRTRAVDLLGVDLVHLDGHVYAADQPGTLSLRIEPAAIEILT
jgi:diacylglycerol kinase (ATP)